MKASLRTLFYCLLTGSLLLPAGCTKKTEEAPDVILLHTGRLRGNVYPPGLQGIAPLQHYPYLAGYIRDVREEAAASGAEVVLVDLGDSIDGSFASHATSGANLVAFFNELDYDAIALGNLDNNLTSELLSGVDAVKLVPFANEKGQPATGGTQFTAKLQKGEIPITLISNFYGDTDAEEFPDRFPSWFGETEEAAVPVRDYESGEMLPPKQEGELRVFSWMKFESPEDPPEEFLEKLRRLEVDLILAHRIYSSKETDSWSSQTNFGHWNPPVSENILRNNGGFALARIDLKKDGDGWRVLRQEILPMTANTADPDSAIVEATTGFYEAIAASDRPLGVMDAPVSESEILTTYMNALTRVPGTDVVIYSPQSIRTGWPSGELRASMVFNSLPWTAPILQIRLTGEELNQVAALNPGLAIYEKTDGEFLSDPLMVTTSRYFASIFARQLEKPVTELTVKELQPEFDYFVDQLALADQPTEATPTTGWILRAQP